MKLFTKLPITLALLLYSNSATAIVSGITCQTGQICCYYNTAGGCMKCATLGNCPTCTCMLYSKTDWTALTDTANTYARCIDAQATAAVTPCDTEFSCDAGYYLTTNNTCEPCPQTNGNGTSTQYNTGGITSCFIPSGTSFSETPGSGQYTNNCYYSN